MDGKVSGASGTQDSPELASSILDTAIDMLRGQGPSGVLPVQGTSMQPLLTPGMQLLIDFAPGPLRRGDLVLFRQGLHAVVHRAVAFTPDGLRARGDNRAHLDPQVRSQDVLGRVVSIGDGDVWRELTGPAARAYALSLAFHNLAWSGLSRLATWMDKGLRRVGLGNAAFRCVRGLDAFNMRMGHRLLFRLAHRRIPRPECAAPGVPHGT